MNKCVVHALLALILNRGDSRLQMGSGHGLTVGAGVAWNCATSDILLEKPPLSSNYAVGCITKRPLIPKTSGVILSHGKHVQPLGLFAYQLAARLGKERAEAVLGIQIVPVDG